MYVKSPCSARRPFQTGNVVAHETIDLDVRRERHFAVAQRDTRAGEAVLRRESFDRRVE